MFDVNNTTVTSETEALLLFAAAISFGEDGYLRPGEVWGVKSVILNDLDISDRLSPETVRLLCMGSYWYTEPSWLTCEGDRLAPWWFERDNGDVTIDNIDTP